MSGPAKPVATGMPEAGDAKPGADAGERALLERLNAHVAPGTFQHFLGLRFVRATPDDMLATLAVRDDHGNRPGVMHGGALMALADTMGGLATRVNLQPGEGTTTVESKTNFLRMVAPGTTVSARVQALHKGRSTMVWQTTIRDGEGRAVAVTTQTQIVLRPAVRG